MPEHQSAELRQLASDFWKWRALHQPNSSDDLPRIERPPEWDPDWSPAAVEQQRADLENFETQLKSFNVSQWSVPQKVDYRLVASALARVRWELDVLCSWERNPRFYVYQALGALFEELLKNRPFDQQRSAEIIECLN